VETVDFSDIQGIVRFAYNHLTEACYLLLRVQDASVAKAWMGSTLPLVSTAHKSPERPATAMQVALTASGLRAIGVKEEVLGGFSAEFLEGLAGDEARSRRLGDVGANAPANWEWGTPGTEPHLLIILMAESGRLSGWRERVETSEFRAAFDTIACLPTSDLHGDEPFGFRDGISQPEIDWHSRPLHSDTVLSYTNLSALGEFLLGYPNEYGKYTQRPLLDPSPDTGYLASAEDDLSQKDLGRNGTYLVLRQLEQDVRGFWTFADRAAGSDPLERVRVAETLVGRRLNGDPIVPLTDSPIAGVGGKTGHLNHFTFDQDPDGVRCPFGAHIRRANPRNVDLPGKPAWFLSRWLRMLGSGIKSFRDDGLASTRFHRVLRRGREYGPKLTIDDAVTSGSTDQGVQRGLQFVCLNANISRQFEFVQGAWLMNASFDGLSGEQDPLLGKAVSAGDCPTTDVFSIPRDGAPPRRLTGLKQFITVRGGAYFFLPGIKALRYFADPNCR